ncbi:MAG: metalloregulator ArsR/SmtB family transcription factor [Spirochaetia bacterium]|nr:metalloregulator ArsR/SmtB family transcription factor [Spirochaetia bacterium]
MKARRDVYQAIADPTRRAIIVLLSDGSYNVNSIAENFKVSRQAISLHVKILTDCGLVSVRQVGRDRFCEAHLDGLAEVSVWLNAFKQHWERRFDSLESYIAKVKRERDGKRKK